MSTLTAAEIGSLVAISINGNTFIGEVTYKTTMFVDVKKRYERTFFAKYSQRTGREFGGKSMARIVTEAEADAIQKQQTVAAEERQAIEERKRQAEYDAVTESVKLSRQLSLVFDHNRPDKFECAPVDAMRTLLAWCEANSIEGANGRIGGL